MYKRLAEVRTDDDVDLIREELRRPVRRAAASRSRRCSLVARFRARARQAGITEVTIAGRNVRFAPVEPARVARRTAEPAVPAAASSRPRSARCSCRARRRAVIGGRPIDGVALLEWARTVIDTVIDPERAPTSESTSASSTISRESS